MAKRIRVMTIHFRDKDDEELRGVANTGFDSGFLGVELGNEELFLFPADKIVMIHSRWEDE